MVSGVFRFIALRVGMPIAVGALAAALPREGWACNRAFTGGLRAVDRRPWLIAVPVIAVGLIVLAALAVSNLHTTGHPLVTPYEVNTATDHHRRIFVFGFERDPPPRSASRLRSLRSAA